MLVSAIQGIVFLSISIYEQNPMFEFMSWEVPNELDGLFLFKFV